MFPKFLALKKADLFGCVEESAIVGLWQSHTRKQVRNDSFKQWDIVRKKLGQIDIHDWSQQQYILVICWILELQVTGCCQHSFDCTHTIVVVELGWQLLINRNCYIARLSLNKMSTAIGWFLITCPWSNSTVSRPGYNCEVVACTPSLFVFAIWLFNGKSKYITKHLIYSPSGN